jgi:hypothetical protein
MTKKKVNQSDNQNDDDNKKNQENGLWKYSDLDQYFWGLACLRVF